LKSDTSIRQKVKPYFLPGCLGFEGGQSPPSNHVKTTPNQSGIGVLLLFLPKKSGQSPSFFVQVAKKQAAIFWRFPKVPKWYHAVL
jgi:hypothetical protein